MPYWILWLFSNHSASENGWPTMTSISFANWNHVVLCFLTLLDWERVELCVKMEINTQKKRKLHDVRSVWFRSVEASLFWPRLPVLFRCARSSVFYHSRGNCYGGILSEREGRAQAGKEQEGQAEGEREGRTEGEREGHVEGEWGRIISTCDLWMSLWLTKRGFWKSMTNSPRYKPPPHQITLHSAIPDF